jgi:hypothetical protein
MDASISTVGMAKGKALGCHPANAGAILVIQSLLDLPMAIGQP